MADIDIGDGDATPLIGGGIESAKVDTESTPLIRRTLACRLMEDTRPCLAEFFGVIVFVFLGTMSGTTGNIVSTAMAHGLTIMLLIIAFGDISGGHFNPCVTFGAFLGGDLSIMRTLFYWLSQLFASVIGAAICKGVLPDEVYMDINGGIPQLAVRSGFFPGTVTIGQGILCEATLTFLLVLTVLMSAVDRKDNILAPVAIGLVVAVDISAAGAVSGAVMNPARAFGPAVVGSSTFHIEAWKNHYVYWVGPFLGASLAGLIYRLLLASPNKRFFCKE